MLRVEETLICDKNTYHSCLCTGTVLEVHGGFIAGTKTAAYAANPKDIEHMEHDETFSHLCERKLCYSNDRRVSTLLASKTNIC